jgi:hypothetical protein
MVCGPRDDRLRLGPGHCRSDGRWGLVGTAIFVLRRAKEHCRIGTARNSYELTRLIMLARAVSLAVLYSLVTLGIVSPAHALTENEIVAKLEAAGYSQIRVVPSGKIQSFKAVKNGKDVSLIVDSSGHIKELQ